MDSIANLSDTAIPRVWQPIRDAFLPELEKHRADIENIRSQTFKYGATDRHMLDVYYPPVDALPASGKIPVLYFFYGGGFFEGDRRLAQPYGLVYTNTGAYFAKHGILTIIADYRLVPGATFPEPVEDLRDAIGWAIANAGEVLSGTDIQADFDHVFLMSHSAGSTHAATLLLHPTLMPPDLRTHIRGIILQGGVYTFKRDEGMSPDAPVLQLYGSWDALEGNMPATLLQRAPETLLSSFPEVVVLYSERDPRDFIENSQHFAVALAAKLGRGIPLTVMKGHNHLSPHWALWTGKGEGWAEEIAKWIKDKLRLA